MRRALALSIPFLFLAAACTYDNGDVQRVTVEPPAPMLECGTLASATIDVDRQIDIDPAGGAGVFVEYAAGGHWHVRTSCDTGKGACAWDILVSPDTGHALSNVTPEALEVNDSLRQYDDPRYPETWQLKASTSSDLDGFTFDTDPGAAVQVDALLDGSCAVNYFYWVGDGALHSGSPSNPLTLVPSPE